MKTQVKSMVAGVMLVGAMAATSQAHASLLIDDFTMDQSVTDTTATVGATSSTVNPLTGTDLINAERTITALSELAPGSAINPASKEEVTIGFGILEANNTTNSIGAVHLNYNFNSTDFSAGATAILLKVLSADLTALDNIQLKLSVNNGSAFTAYQTLNTANFSQSFASFSGSTDFTHVTNLSLDFIGNKGWDGQFQLLTTNQIPEPATLGLIGLGLAGIGYRKRKQA
jgi:hypothetical protein